MIVEAEDIHVHFPRGLGRAPIKALDGLSLQVQRGDIFALLGPNGAGKSTALYCLLGLLRPRAGRVSILGETPFPGAPIFDRIAYLPEEPHYHLHLTIGEMVAFYTSLQNTPPTRAQVSATLEKLDLGRFEDLKMESCSKGMKQKAGLAACLLAEPEIIFMDEPTRGLDPETTNHVRTALLDAAKKGGTVIMNSHVLAEVESVCNRVAILKNGKTLLQDDVRNLRKTAGEEYLVEMDPLPDLPDYFTLIERRVDAVKGSVHKSRIRDLFSFAEDRNAVVRECALHQRSLEDAFLAALKDAPQ